MFILGNSLDKLRDIKSNTVDLVCTDPPYGYGFMGKSWDRALPDIGIFKECLRVLKPGAFAFVMSAPRSDVCARMMLMLEDAGFQIGFTPLYWTYASGFPKALNIRRAVDKRADTSRECMIGRRRPVGRPRKATTRWGASGFARRAREREARVLVPAPASPSAEALQGSYAGFQPKPAVEVIIVAMKPLSEPTFVGQALQNGKGVTWLDDVRIPPKGRFPANVLVSDDVLGTYSEFFTLDAWARTLPFLAVLKASMRERNAGCGALPIGQTTGGGGTNHARLGSKYGSIKAAGHNFHPTVKPLALMSYLITLGSRAGDVVLDPFVGSGTTAVAAKALAREYIGIERDADYLRIAEARVADVSAPDVPVAQMG